MTKLRNLLNVNSLTNLFTGAVLVTAASLVNGFFAYILQLYLGRTLSIADYGTFNVFLSLFSILTVLNTGIGTATIKVVSELFGNNKRDELAKIFWKLTQIFSIL